MSTKNIVPRSNGEGSLGTSDKKWSSINVNTINVDTINGAQMTGATSTASGKSGVVPAPSAGSQTKYLRGDGTWQTVTTSNMIGASESTAGTAGLVPAPSAGEQEKFLRADGTWATVEGGMSAIIHITTLPNAVVTCTGSNYSSTVTADAEGEAELEINKLGQYTLKAKLGRRTSLNTATVTVETITVYPVTLSFYEAILTVSAESEAVVTLTDGDFETTKTSEGTPLTFSVYNVGTCSVVATKNNVNSDTQTFEFTESVKNGTVNLNFIKLTVKGIINETITISKDSYSYTKVLDSTEQTIIYLPEIGTWSCVGVGTKNSETKTKNKSVVVTEYTNYSVNLWSIVYGYYIDQNDAVESTCVHQIEGLDNYGFSPIKMTFASNVENNTLSWGSWQDSFIMPRPCMLRHNGTVDYYLNPNDYTKKEDGTTSDVTNTSYDGEAMMEWVPIFKKVVNDTSNNRLYVYLSDSKEDSDYECYSCLKADGTYAEHWYTPIYEGSVISSKMRSLSTGAKPTVNTSMASEMTYARANGTGWDITCWADEDLIRCLAPLVLGRLNVELAIGYNCGSSSSSITHNCGTANKKGMFFGHSTTSAYATKFFGMENWWGHRWRRCTGLFSNGYKIYVKLTKHTGDGSTVSDYSNSSSAGYIDSGITIPSMNQSYIKKMSGTKQVATIPTVGGGSATTYYCDGGWSASGLAALLCGGSVYYGSLSGLFAVALYASPSRTAWDYGASLSYKSL